MNEIDLLTLKLLTSKRQYNHYLANANPEKSAEIEEYKQKVEKYVPKMKTLIGKYFENPETQTSNDVDDVIENCFKTLIKHFEMQDFEKKNSEEEEDEEEETLFGNCVEETKPSDSKSNSYWGKNINKTSLDHFIKKK
jgi:hypothetical protein